MKIGDRLAVQIEGVDVAEAIIEDVDDGNAIIIIPATRIVVKIKNDLDFAATDEPEVDRLFVGVENNNKDESSIASNSVNSYTADVGEGIHGRDLDSSAID